MSTRTDVAIIGSGPAGLMAAHVCASSGLSVRIFEKKKGPGRKFLIAGSSGLNVTYDAPPDEFLSYYRGPADRFREFLDAFPPEAWLGFIHALGIETFKGTSRRWFVKGLKASTLLRAWLNDLGKQHATIAYEHECTGFDPRASGVLVTFAGQEPVEARAVCFALGGGSWEETEKPLRWPRIFTDKGLSFHQFAPSNVGYEVDWPAGFLKEAEGQPLKNIALTTPAGTKRGDLVITRYGIEGTPVYFLGRAGQAFLDLKPDLTVDKLYERLSSGKEKRSALWRVKHRLNLCPASMALVAHLAGPADLTDLVRLAARLKKLPITLKGPRPLDEAISSAGGLTWDEVDGKLMLKRMPGVFVAGEMLDWDAPTGGFLIQGCVSQGYFAGRAITRYLRQV